MSRSIIKTKYKEKFFKSVFAAAAVFSILAVVSIIVFLFYSGFPAIRKIGFFEFIFNAEWKSSSADTYADPLFGSYGILTMIVGSIYASVGAVLIGGGLGFFTAVFLSRFCPRKLKKILTQAVNLLAGIPSVIYGFFGMRVLLPALGIFSANGDGGGILAVSIVLGIMIMPTVTALSKSSLDAVDKSYYEGSLALGANEEQSVFKVLVPAAKSGIFASLVLGTGRAIGETMAVVMLAGNNAVFPEGLFASFRTMTANIVLEMSYAGELQMGALVATGVVLTFFILVINICFNVLKGDGKGKKKITLSGGKRADASKSGEVDGIPKNGFLNDKTDADGIPKNGFLNDKTDIESIRKNAFSENGQGILNSQVGVSAFENGIKGIQDKGFLNAENDIENIPKSGFLNAENDIENIPKNGFLNAENDIENIPKNGFLNAENNIESIPKSGFLSEKNDGHGIQKSGFFQSGKEIPNTRGGSGGGQNAAKKPKKDLSKIGKRASYAAAAIGIFSLLSIVFFVLANGLPYMNASLLFGKFEYGGDPSIASSVVSTGMLVLLSSVIAFPIGIGAAIYLAEYTAKGGVFVRIIRLTVDTLGGIPSIVYGLFGMVFFCDLLGLGTSVLAGCLTVSLMIIPTTVRGTEEALLAVPDSLREGAYALGDSRIGTIFKVVIPSALPGIFAAVLLGIGRMAAESAPVLFTMGASLKPMPTGYKSSGTTLAVALYALSREGLHVNEAYACACILILIVLTLNVISTLLVSKLQKKLAGITAKKLKA